MLRGILGKKLGMTQVFDSNGYVKAVKAKTFPSAEHSYE